MKVLFSCLITLVFFSSGVYAKNKSGYTYYQLLTGQDLDPDRSRWDKVYLGKRNDHIYGKNPAPYLVEHYSKIPKTGKVLDVAMGEGRNAVFLAKKGYHVVGVDFSPVAIQKAKKLAKEKKVKIQTIIADLKKFEISPESFDGILVFYYLQRSFIPKIIKGLKKGGVLFYESYTIEQLKYDKKFDKEALLELGELKKIIASFPEMQILHDREIEIGKEAVASLVAVKK